MMKLAYFVFCVICCLDFDIYGSAPKTVDQSIEPSGIADFLDRVGDDTIVVIDCKEALFSQSDTVFVLGNKKKYWEFLQQKRKNLDEDRNKEIDRQIAMAQVEKVSTPLCDKLRSIKGKGSKMVLFFPTQNEIPLSSEGIGVIKRSLVSLTGVSEYWKAKTQSKDDKGASDIIVSNPEELFAQLQQLISNIPSEKKSQIKEIIFLSRTNCLKNFQNKISGVPVVFKQITSESRNNFLTDELISKQFDILINQNVWFSDQVLQEYSGKSPEETMYEICIQKILQVCSCREINESNIYKFITAILGQENVPTYAPELIEDFQVLKDRFLGIAFFAAKMILIKHSALDQKKVFSAIRKTPGLEFIQEKEYVSYNPSKVLKSIGSGVHWKDMLAYNYVRNLINPQFDLEKPKYYPEERYLRYLKTLQIVANHFDLPNKVRNVKEVLLRNLLKEGITIDQISSAYNFRQYDLSAAPVRN